MKDYCVCGAAVRNVWENAYQDLPPEERPAPRWSHVPGSDTRCTDVRLIRDLVPDGQMIRDTAQLMASLNDRARRARAELEGYPAVLAEVTEELARIRSTLDQPDTVRRATLVEVWERLVNGGQLPAAKIIMAIMRETKGDES